MRVHKPDKPSFKYYAKIAGAVERQLFDEMNKPAKDRDQALISECLYTLDTIHASARALEEKAEHSKSRIHTRGWRRAAVIATIVIAALLSLAGIAEAVGIRIINLIKWDKNGLSINFGPNIRQGDPPAHGVSGTKDPGSYKIHDTIELPGSDEIHGSKKVPVKNEVSDSNHPSKPQEKEPEKTNSTLEYFDSFEEACEAVFGYIPPMPDYLPAGAELDSSLGRKGDHLYLNYKADAGIIELFFHYIGDMGDSYAIGIMYPDAIDYKSFEKERIKYNVTIMTDDRIAVDWVSGAFRLHISTQGYGMDEVMKIISSFQGGNN